MKPAKRLTKIGIWFKGPHSADLFEALWIYPSEFDDVFIGTGESKAVAAMRALAHMQGKGLSAIYEAIEREVQTSMPPRSTTVEGDHNCSVYCIVGICYDV